jgi:hypothetical protein
VRPVQSSPPLPLSNHDQTQSPPCLLPPTLVESSFPRPLRILPLDSLPPCCCRLQATAADPRLLDEPHVSTTSLTSGSHALTPADYAPSSMLHLGPCRGGGRAAAAARKGRRGSGERGDSPTAFSSSSHFCFRDSCAAACLSMFILWRCVQSSQRRASMSMKSFCTLKVSPCTVLFQCLVVLASSAGYSTGRITGL